MTARPRILSRTLLGVAAAEPDRPRPDQEPDAPHRSGG
jgi:hypothetical protein